jgi:hypothetical protein
MHQQPHNQPNSRNDPALRQWITALVLVALLLGCLGLIIVMAGPGINVSGQTIHFKLVSEVTQSPFCPPEDPRLSSMLLEQKRWIVCFIRETKTAQGAGRTMHKLVDLPLW